MAQIKWTQVVGTFAAFAIGSFLLSCNGEEAPDYSQLRSRLAQGEQAQVREEARQLSLDPPRTVAARLPLARLLIDVDLARRAVAILEEERLNAEARDVLALAQLRTDDTVHARALVDEQLAASTDSALTHRVLGELLLRDLDWRGARAALNEARTRDPDDPFTSVLLAASHLHDQDPGSAERVLRDARRRFPHDPVIAGELAAVILASKEPDKGKLREAEVLLRQAVARRPLSEGYVERLSTTLMTLGEAKEAKTVLLGLTKQWPENPRHWNRLGLVCRELGDLPGAVEAFERAVRCSQGEGRETLYLYLNLGSAQLLMADIEGEDRAKWGQAAWRTFQAAQKIGPNDASVFLGLAKATVNTDPAGERVRAAIQLYLKALELIQLRPYPTEMVHEVHLNLALLFHDLWISDRANDSEGRRKALHHFREAEKLVPPDRWHPSAVTVFRELEKPVKELDVPEEKEEGK